MAYYLEGSKNIEKITEDYLEIESLDDLYLALKELWNKETCTPRLRNSYSEDNPSLGQCSITSFLAQDIFGGEVYGIALKEGGVHCYNVVGDTIFDLTSEQFKEELVYDKDNKQEREDHFESDEKYARYLHLRKMLHAFKK